MNKSKFNPRRFIAGVLIVVLALVVIGMGTFLGLQISGKNKLYSKTGSGPNLDTSRLPQQQVGEGSELLDPEDEDYQQGDVQYNGKIYRYNEDILTFLFMGIDKKEEVHTAENDILGGQNDANFLVVLNPHDKSIQIVGINRNTMTDIDVFSPEGIFQRTIKAQLCLAHGFGDGRQISCARAVTTVSKLFYGLPIHGYCALNLAAFADLNDAVGGVDLEVLEDIIGTDLKQGQQVHLTGQLAQAYIHNRDTDSFGSADGRLQRQKQYLMAFVEKALAATRQDISVPVKLYSDMSKYMVTDVTIDEVTYLVSQAVGYSFDRENVRMIKGETVLGESGFEEHYIDEVDLYETIRDVFYEEIGN